MDVPTIGPIFGAGAGLLWKSYETFAQIRWGAAGLLLDWLLDCWTAGPIAGLTACWWTAACGAAAAATCTDKHQTTT